MITAIVYSKDRPLQLDLCLNSIAKNFDQASSVIVIYKATDIYEESYRTLQSEHPDVIFILQGGSIFKDTLDVISSTENDFVCFFTDDDIVYQKVPNIRYDILGDEGFISVHERGSSGERLVTREKVESQIHCFSLRMGLNITKRFHEGHLYEDTPVPSMLQRIDEQNMCWAKTLREYGSYWSYSLSVDGHIFRKKDMELMFDEMWYLNQKYTDWEQTPNRIESVMQRFWTDSKPLIASFINSVVVNSPNNRVQDSHLSNRFGEAYNYDADTLLEKYLLGRRINIDKLNFGQIECPHTEIDLMRGMV